MLQRKTRLTAAAHCDITYIYISVVSEGVATAKRWWIGQGQARSAGVRRIIGSDRTCLWIRVDSYINGEEKKKKKNEKKKRNSNNNNNSNKNDC